MHLPLFKALKSLTLDDDRATEVVTSVEEHIAMKIHEANAGLRADIKALDATVKGDVGSLRSEIQSLKWLFAAFGTLMVLGGLAPNIAKLFH